MERPSSVRPGYDRPRTAAEGCWLGVHSHMSLARGVPLDSHGNGAMKAHKSDYILP